MRTLILILFSLFLFLPQSVSAQFQIGGSYEIRNYTPGYGFGLQVEVPKPWLFGLQLRYRGSYSNYNEDRIVFVESSLLPDQEAQQSLKTRNLNMGSLAELPLPFAGWLVPYAGLTFGVEFYESAIRLDVNDPDIPIRRFRDDDRGIEFTGIIGVRAIVLSRFSPFAEFRYSTFGATTYIPNPQQRVAFGMAVIF